MATASNYYVNVRLADSDTRLVRLESSRDFENIVEYVMRHSPKSFPLRSKVFFTYDYKGAKGTVSTPLELHHAIHLDKAVDDERLELVPATKAR
ncbi:Ubiquitin-like domain-containing protein [Plasmodiophora brassicae]